MALRGSLREEGGFLAVLAKRLADCHDHVTAALGATPAAEREHHGATMHLDQILANRHRWSARASTSLRRRIRPSGR